MFRDKKHTWASVSKKLLRRQAVGSRAGREESGDPPCPPQSGLAGLLSKASPVRYTAETSTHLSDVGLTLPCGSPEKWEPQGGADVSNEQGKVRGMNNRKGAEEGNPEGAWVVDQMTPMSLKCACIFLKFGPNIG